MNEYNENQAEFYFGIGNQIVKEGIFERFPELRPAVGYPNYWRKDGKHNKMLLVGESNYFDDRDIPYSDFLDAEKWYKAEDAKLIPEYAQTKVSNNIGGYPTFNKFFKIMSNVLNEAGIEHFTGLGEAAFYNYFLRPAYNDGKHKGFIPQNIDREVSGIALSGILDRINPDLVIFLSKKAYTEFGKFCKRNNVVYENIVIEHVSHPASIWWNRDGGIRGKVKFEQLLKEYWINKQSGNK